MDHMDMEQTQTQMQEAPDSSSQYDDIAHTFTMGGDYVQPHLTNRYAPSHDAGYQGTSEPSQGFPGQPYGGQYGLGNSDAAEPQYNPNMGQTPSQSNISSFEFDRPLHQGRELGSFRYEVPSGAGAAMHTVQQSEVPGNWTETRSHSHMTTSHSGRPHNTMTPSQTVRSQTGRSQTGRSQTGRSQTARSQTAAVAPSQSIISESAVTSSGSKRVTEDEDGPASTRQKVSLNVKGKNLECSKHYLGKFLQATLVDFTTKDAKQISLDAGGTSISQTIVTNNIGALEIELFNAAYKIVDDPQYMPPPKAPANLLSPDIPNPGASTDQNPDKGKNRLVDNKADDLLRETKESFDRIDDVLKGDRHAHAPANEVLQEMIRKEGKEKHRVDSPFLPCQIPTGYESVDQEKRLIAHFSAPGLRRAVIKILLIFGHEAIKMVMGAGGVASERVLATVTALLHWALIRRLEGSTITDISKELATERDECRAHFKQKVTELCHLITYIQLHGDEEASLSEIVRQIRVAVLRWANTTHSRSQKYRSSTHKPHYLLGHFINSELKFAYTDMEFLDLKPQPNQ